MGRLELQFLDTRLLLERLAGRLAHDSERRTEFRTGRLNVFELVHLLLKAGKKAVAKQAYDDLADFTEELTESRIFGAARLRIIHAGLSYADAAAYVTARELGAVLVTSEENLARLPGVRRVQLPL